MSTRATPARSVIRTPGTGQAGSAAPWWAPSGLRSHELLDVHLSPDHEHVVAGLGRRNRTDDADDAVASRDDRRRLAVGPVDEVDAPHGLTCLHALAHV